MEKAKIEAVCNRSNCCSFAFTLFTSLIKFVDRYVSMQLSQTQTIGGPIQCVVSYRDQCAHKHTSYIIKIWNVYMCTLISIWNYTLNWAACAQTYLLCKWILLKLHLFSWKRHIRFVWFYNVLKKGSSAHYFLIVNYMLLSEAKTLVL